MLLFQKPEWEQKKDKNKQAKLTPGMSVQPQNQSHTKRSGTNP